MRRQSSARVSSVIDGVAIPRPTRAGGRGSFQTQGTERWNDITGYLVRAKNWIWRGARRRERRDLCTRNWPAGIVQKQNRPRQMRLQRQGSQRFEATTIWSMATDTPRPATQSPKRGEVQYYDTC